jgi:hypothetical protein
MRLDFEIRPQDTENKHTGEYEQGLEKSQKVFSGPVTEIVLQDLSF